MQCFSINRNFLAFIVAAIVREQLYLQISASHIIRTRYMSMSCKLHQPDHSTMADLQRDGGDPNDPSVPFFDFENYYEEHHAEPESTPDAGTQGPNSPRSPGRMLGFEPYYEQGDSSEAAISQTYVDAFTDNRFESLEGPSQPPTTTGNEPLHQYGQPSSTDIPNAELHRIEDELEEVELSLKRCELLRRRRGLLQNSSTGQQAQTSERPGFQNLGTASDSSAQLNRQGATSNEPSQRSALFVSIMLGLT